MFLRPRGPSINDIWLSVLKEGVKMRPVAEGKEVEASPWRGDCSTGGCSSVVSSDAGNGDGSVRSLGDGGIQFEA